MSATLSSWRPSLDAYNDSLRAVADACAQFVAAIEAGAPEHWLTLSGLAGCGKTMLARQVFDVAARLNPFAVGIYARNPHDENDRRPGCAWMDATSMFRRMVEGHEHDLPEYLRRDWLVVIDDLGAARDKSGYLADAIYRLANNRLRRWTIWTTNLSHREISSQIDDRVASRLIRDGNVAVRIDAGDYAARATPKRGKT